MALPAIILGGTLATLAAGWIYSLRVAEAEAERAGTEHAAARAMSFQTEAEFLVRRAEWDQLSSVILALGADPEVRMAAVVDTAGSLLASTGPTAFERVVVSTPASDTGVRPRLLRAALGGRSAVEAVEKTRRVLAAYPIRAGSGQQTIAALVIESDLAPTRAAFDAAINRQMWRLGFVLVALSAAFAFAFHRLVSRRLAKIERAVRERAAGLLEATSEVAGPDEIGQVGEAFDHLVSELNRREEELRQSESRFRTLVEHAPEAIVITDADSGQIVDVNPTAEVLLKRSRTELTGQTAADLSPPTQGDGVDSAQLASRLLKEVMEGATASVEWNYRAASGEVIPCDVRAVHLPAANRRLVRWSVSDARPRKIAQAKLMRAQKLESVGRLAGGVAHDFNNVLSVILTSAELMERDRPPGPGAYAKLVEVKEAANRGAALTRQLLAFAGRQVIEPHSIDPNVAIPSLAAMLERLLGEDITLVVVAAPEPWFVKIDQGHLEQVVVNLAVNARDAMPTGGVLTIRIEGVQTTEHLATGLAPGEYVRIVVRDTGIGFDQTIRDRIFEPFFTTKDKSKGTGLGLATCYGIATSNGGTIVAESEPGHGAEFSVYLPRTLEPPPEAVVPPKAAPRARPNVERILLVEDEKSLRTVTALALEEEGYQVQSASNAKEAIGLVGDGGPIHALVTDVVMPGLSGPELADQLRRSFGDLRVLYTSGHDDEQIQRYGGVAADAAFLQKPYSLTTLLNRLRELLDQPAVDEGSTVTSAPLGRPRAEAFSTGDQAGRIT